MATTGQRYKEENYDKVAFWVKKGKKEEYQQAAVDFGLGQGEMYRLAVETFISERSLQPAPLVKLAPMTAQPAQEKLTTEQRRLLDEFGRLPAEAQKHFLQAFRAINKT